MRLVGRRSNEPAETVPAARVLVHPELVREVAGFASASPVAETGGPLLGTLQRSWEGRGTTFIVSILGTVPPGPGLRASSCSVALGSTGDGERAAAALRWLRSATGLDLLHLGDWHTHPGGLARPSEFDVSTAGEMAPRGGAAPWLVAIVATRAAAREELTAHGKGVSRRVASSDSIDLRVYREAGRAGLVPVAARLDAHALPRLPAPPWHIADSERFAAECRLLAAAGYRIAVEERPMNGSRDLTLRLQRDGGRPFDVVTGPNHPLDEPRLGDARGRSVPLRKWSPDRFLADVVQELGR
jgi:hypothetical protein